MRQSTIFGTALLLAAGGLAAAQQQSPYEEVVLQILKSLQQTTKILTTIEDAASAEAARAPLKNAVEQFVAARTKAEKMKQPDKEERERIVEKYQKKLAEAVREFRSEYQRARGIPGSAQALEELKPLLEPPGKKKKSESESKNNEP